MHDGQVLSRVPRPRTALWTTQRNRGGRQGGLTSDATGSAEDDSGAGGRHLSGLRLPAPYPGELIDSVLSRGVIHTGLAPKRLLYRLVGNKRSGHSFLLPPSLKHLAEEMGIEPVHLLWRHTVFPFTVAFMAQRKSCARTKRY